MNLTTDFGQRRRFPDGALAGCGGRTARSKSGSWGIARARHLKHEIVRALVGDRGLEARLGGIGIDRRQHDDIDKDLGTRILGDAFLQPHDVVAGHGWGSLAARGKSRPCPVGHEPAYTCKTSGFGGCCAPGTASCGRARCVSTACYAKACEASSSTKSVALACAMRPAGMSLSAASSRLTIGTFPAPVASQRTRRARLIMGKVSVIRGRF